MDLTTINAEEVVAEVRAVFEGYERALVADDHDRLEQAFWASELTVRYGVAERLYGADAINSWRRSSRPTPAGRRLGPTVIATFGRHLACVSTEFRHDRSDAVGRQSQTWLRLPDGWKIVAAHVSLEAA